MVQQNSKTRSKGGPRSNRRRGVTTVEFAICVPVLFLFTFASLEFSRVNSLRQSAANAVYEGCRRGIVPGATATDVRDASQLVLDSVLARGGVITVSPTTIDEDTPEVTVDIVVPVDDNSWVIANFFQGREITASMTMIRERGLNSVN